MLLSVAKFIQNTNNLWRTFPLIPEEAVFLPREKQDLWVLITLNYAGTSTLFLAS